jgi:hypothetical protein
MCDERLPVFGKVEKAIGLYVKLKKLKLNLLQVLTK